MNGPNVTYLGPFDFHDEKYDGREVASSFNNTAFRSIEECTYSFHIFPTQELVDEYETILPETSTAGVVVIFLIVSLAFVLYDWIVERRQNKVMTSAMRTGAVVNSLFPAQVRERLMDQHVSPHVTAPTSSSSATNTVAGGTNKKSKMKGLVDSHAIQQLGPSGTGEIVPSTKGAYSTKPIADLFPHASVLFGDLVGFTSWSSSREPAQVFTLLETLFHAFDKAARKYGVFKGTYV